MARQGLRLVGVTIGIREYMRLHIGDLMRVNPQHWYAL